MRCPQEPWKCALSFASRLIQGSNGEANAIWYCWMWVAPGSFVHCVAFGLERLLSATACSTHCSLVATRLEGALFCTWTQVFRWPGCAFPAAWKFALLYLHVLPSYWQSFFCKLKPVALRWSTVFRLNGSEQAQVWCRMFLDEGQVVNLPIHREEVTGRVAKRAAEIQKCSPVQC